MCVCVCVMYEKENLIIEYFERVSECVRNFFLFFFFLSIIFAWFYTKEILIKLFPSLFLQYSIFIRGFHYFIPHSLSLSRLSFTWIRHNVSFKFPSFLILLIDNHHHLPLPSSSTPIEWSVKILLFFNWIIRAAAAVTSSNEIQWNIWWDWYIHCCCMLSSSSSSDE